MRGDRARSSRPSTCGGCGCGTRPGATSPTSSSRVAPGAAVGQGHAVADAVEEAVQRALPGERRRRPRRAGARTRPIRDRAHARRADGARGARGAQRHRAPRSATAPRSRSTSSSRASCRWSRRTRSRGGRARDRRRGSRGRGRCRRTSSRSPRRRSGGRRTAIRSASRSSGSSARPTGAPPRSLRFLRTDEGLVAYLTLAVEPDATLAEAHARASEVENAIRPRCPRIADVIVHTEP